MYIDKIMREHNLMQAIARVNRVYPGKNAGLIVDYIGLGKYLRDALNKYTARDKNAVESVEKAKELLITEIEILEDMFHGFDFSKYFKSTPKERFELIQDGVEHVLKERAKVVFLDHVERLRNAYKICSTSVDFETRIKVSFFLAIKSFIVKVERDGKISKEEIANKLKYKNIETSNDVWSCPKCKMDNKNISYKCYKCGYELI